MPESQKTQQPSGWLPRLLSFWAVAALVAFAVMLTHQSDDTRFFGRYSTLVIIQIGLLLVLALAAGGAGWILRQRPVTLERIYSRLNRLRENRLFFPLVLAATCIVLFVVWVFYLSNSLATYGFLRAFIGLTIALIAMASLYGGATLKAVVRVSPLQWAGVVILLVVALITIGYYPVLAKADEAFVFSMGRNALENGQFRPLIYRQAYPPYYYGGVWTWMMAAWLRVAGVSLTSGRLYVLALSAISLAFIWGAAERLYNRVTAGFAVLIGAYAFIALNHIRFDIHTAFWLSAGLFFYSLGQKSGRWWAQVLAGFLVGMGVDSNPIAYCFGLGLGLAYLWEYVRVIRSEKRWFWFPFWGMALGGAAALGLYLLIHAGQSFAGGGTTGSQVSTYTSSILGGFSSGKFLVIAGQYLTTFLTNQPILFVLMVLGLIVALIERKAGDRLLLCLSLAWTGIIVFTYFYFPAFYLMLALPMFILLAARGVAGGLPWLLGSEDLLDTLYRTVTILLLVWLGAAVVYDLKNLSSQSVEDVVETGSLIGQIIPKDATIVAAEPYYFGLIDHPNFTGGAVESILVNLDHMTAEDAWNTVAPDAVVFSQNWSTEPAQTAALMAYLSDHHFGLLACYQTKSFGRIELWTRDGLSTTPPSEDCTTVKANH